MAKRSSYGTQDYRRTPGQYLADPRNFPRLDPPLAQTELIEAIKLAVKKCGLSKKGLEKQLTTGTSAEQISQYALDHILQWLDPVDGIILLCSRPAEDVFMLDTVPAEIQTHRMALGNFYHYMMLELMQATSKTPNSLIERANGGSRSGDIIADLRSPLDSRGICLYGSVKKHIRTVGGQDIRDAVRRLEKEAQAAQHLTRPYLCATMIANPIPGRHVYEDSRFTGMNRNKDPHSPNAEIWGPEFIFPYISGHSPSTIFQLAWDIWAQERPYYTLIHQQEASKLLIDKLSKLGLMTKDGKLDRNALLRATFVSEKLAKSSPQDVASGDEAEEE